MKRISALAAALFLSACVNQATLISQDGARYHMDVNQVARKLTSNIDGVIYTGTAVVDESVGFGVGQSLGSKPKMAIGTSIMQGNNGKALLVAPNGDYIECGFNKSGTTVIGRCESNKGRQFVLTTE